MKNKALVILGCVCAILLSLVAFTMFRGDKQENTEEKETVEESQNTYITYNGMKYKKNGDIRTVLFMGVDKAAEVVAGNVTGYSGQADSLNLLVLNTETKQAEILQISREAMVNIDVYTENGEKVMTAPGQIALQYAYGDGGKGSCRLVSEKVSELLSNTDIDSYLSLSVDGIAAATDALGGVVITIPEDYTDIDPAFEQGKEVRLNGQQAEAYVRSRDIEVLDSNNQRMDRQTQFMGALVHQMQSEGKSQEELAALYAQIEPYIVTNMTAEELSKLSEYDISDEITRVPGEVIEKDEHAQFIVDNEKLKEILVKMFYKEADL